MHIVVAVKAAPLGAPRARLDADGRWLEPSEWRLDPINELTVAWAAQTVGSGAAAAATAVSCGGAPAEFALREALARGCTDALRLEPEADGHLDLAGTARLLAAAAKRLEAAIVVCGDESYDASSGALPAALAAELDWPVVSRARTATVSGDGAVVAHRAGSTVTASDPVVLSLTEGDIESNAPRIAALLATRRRPIPALPSSQLLAEGDLGDWTNGLRGLEVLPSRRPDTQVLGAAEGVRAIGGLLAAARAEDPVVAGR